MELVQRSIFAAHLQTCKLLNRPFTILENSTLNQKFDVFASDTPALNEYPSLKYAAIGNKGVDYEIGTNNYILTKPVSHLPRHSSLYNFIPFIVRPINNDLTSTERAQYRMRVITAIGGVQYAFYYLRVLNLDNVIPSVEMRNVNDTVITSSVFSPTLSDLSPTPPVVSNVNLNNPNGDYLVSTAKINFTLSATDISEIMDACSLIYGDSRYAVISEIALCTGIDKVQQGVFGSTTAPYTESIVTQIASYIHQYHALTSNTTGVDILFDLGSVEPISV